MTWRTAAAAGLLLLTAGGARAQWRDPAPGAEAAVVAQVWPAAWGDGRGRFAPGGFGGGRRGGGYGGRFGGGGGAYGGGYGPAGYGGGPAYPRPEGAYGAGAGWRRGQVLPPAARGAYVPDPGRYHLRAAPPGYGWVGDGRDAYLTQRSTGLVLDRVPRAYEPAPAWRGRGRGPR